jgi:uncharacterized membrane protein YsdA (DUF1294 family)
VYGFDKIQALKNSKNISRVPEFRLLVIEAIGGTIGAITSMILFRHKIKKLSFMIKFIAILLAQSLGYYFIVLKDIIQL